MAGQYQVDICLSPGSAPIAWDMRPKWLHRFSAGGMLLIASWERVVLDLAQARARRPKSDSATTTRDCNPRLDNNAVLPLSLQEANPHLANLPSAIDESCGTTAMIRFIHLVDSLPSLPFIFACGDVWGLGDLGIEMLSSGGQQTFAIGRSIVFGGTDCWRTGC